MQRTMPGNTINDPAAFAMFAGDTLTIDFKKLARVCDQMRNWNQRYDGEMQRAVEAARSAQGEVTRCNNEVAVLKEAVASLCARLKQVEDKVDIDARLAETNEPVRRRRWWQRG